MVGVAMVGVASIEVGVASVKLGVAMGVGGGLNQDRGGLGKGRGGHRDWGWPLLFPFFLSYDIIINIH